MEHQLLDLPSTDPQYLERSASSLSGRRDLIVAVTAGTSSALASVHPTSVRIPQQTSENMLRQLWSKLLPFLQHRLRLVPQISTDGRFMQA